MNACVCYLGNTFVSVGQVWDQFQLLLVNQPVVLIERLGKWKKEDSNGLGTVWCD
jgi:hypothetical protein